VSALGELPIGAGQAKRRWREPEDLDERDDPEAGAGVLPPSPAPSPLVEVPRIEIVEWDARKLRMPLKVVGRTVNWRIRRQLQLETEAGLMTDENLVDIGEPLAEIANRYEPTRAFASRATELALVAAVYDYVQETAVKAGRAKQYAIDVERAAAHARAAVAPDLAVEGEVPEL